MPFSCRKSRPLAPAMSTNSASGAAEGGRDGLLFAVVALLVNRAQELMNERAVYAVAALAGLTDVDAITLSMARESDHERAPLAVTAITIAVLTNTLVKTGLAWGLGSSNLRRRIVPTAAVIAAGAVVSILVAR